MRPAVLVPLLGISAAAALLAPSDDDAFGVASYGYRLAVAAARDDRAAAAPIAKPEKYTPHAKTSLR